MADQEQQEPRRQCEPWCEVGSAYRQCMHILSSTDAPLFVAVMKDPSMPAARVVIALSDRFGRTAPMVVLEPEQAQSLSTMLAFAAPSQPIAALGFALAEAAAVLFRQQGLPDVGPRRHAFNPWKPDRSSTG